MNGLRVASMCTGYGGLDDAVMSVLGGELVWVADNDPGAAKILARRFPSVPNLGDITTVDWAAVEPVDILTTGFPCTDVSCAGARAGLRAGTRSGVWTYCARAISQLRPLLVVIENVRGLLSAGADSPVEPCPWCLGETGDEHALRGAGAVLGDLADIGYDAEWATVSASDAGAPHRRERVFIVARPAADAAAAVEGWRVGARSGSWRNSAVRDEAGTESGHGDGPFATDPERDGRRWRAGGAGEADESRPGSWPAVAGRGTSAEDADSPTGGERRLTGPGEAEGGRPRADAGRSGGAPVAADAEHDGLAASQDAGTGEGSQQRQRGSRRVATESAGDRSPRTPADADSTPGGRHEPGSRPSAVQGTAVAERVPEQPGRLHSGGGDASAVAIAWGAYEPAIRRWERVLGRPAPAPTEPGRTGQRLSPRFVEFLMGLPEGWVTDVPGLSRNAQLKALGNGVVPQQAAMALRMLLGHSGTEMAA